MSLASSIPACYNKLPSSSSSSCLNTTSSSTSSSSSSSNSFSFMFTPCTKAAFVSIRSSKAEGPLRRPAAPPTIREPSSSPSMKPVAPSPPPPPPPPSKSVSSTVMDAEKKVVDVTVEFQRKMAKELQDYFRQKKLEEADKGPFFGFRAKNEISNGRWAMFGFAVGMLTEYATGSDFVDQLKILLSNFGIVDLD